MIREHFKLAGVEALDGFRLLLEYTDNFSCEVDLGTWLEKNACLEKLKSRAIFKKVRLGAGGWSVDWDKSGDLSLASDNLRNLGYEQAGMVGHERIWEWMHRNHLSIPAAAVAIGVSPRMISYYRSGRKPIPAHIWLACRGWELIPTKERLTFQRAA
ncbi:MAG: helix-turn-helix transcriptional regulator [Candidatus Ozemobacteraceae bacterium]